jgi:ribonuclease HI
MGAAMVCLENQVPSRSVAVSGPPSSPRAELIGILLALEEPEESVDANIQTDSLLSIQ